VAEPPIEEEPIDLDGTLAALDDELRKLDELTDKDRNFPAEMAAIEKKHEALTNQELDSVEAIQSRSAEMSKIAAMRELSLIRQKKLKSSITDQTASVIKIGTRAASLLEKLWWDLHKEAFAQAETEFNRLFFHAFESLATLNSYKPLVLLRFLKFPDLYTSSVDLKITRFRGLRSAVDKLGEFAAMTFAGLANGLRKSIVKARSELNNAGKSARSSFQESPAIDFCPNIFSAVQLAAGLFDQYFPELSIGPLFLALSE
jgi:hypothetical protein